METDFIDKEIDRMMTETYVMALSHAIRIVSEAQNIQTALIGLMKLKQENEKEKTEAE